MYEYEFVIKLKKIIISRIMQLESHYCTIIPNPAIPDNLKLYVRNFLWTPK